MYQLTYEVTGNLVGGHGIGNLDKSKISAMIERCTGSLTKHTSPGLETRILKLSLER